jgi:transcriptional regulator with XRE-family HTH domain
MNPERNPNPTASLGPVLRAIREGARMSQGSLALAANVTKSHLSRVEAGHRDISPELLHKVLSAIADRLLHRDAA